MGERTTIGRVADIATVALVVVALGMGGSSLWQANRRASDGPGPRPDREVRDWETLAQDGRWMGPRDASVVILEFGDYECPYCRRMAGPLEAARRHYPDKVALVYRHFPLPNHPNAYRASRFAECAADHGLFEAAHGALYRVVTLDGLDGERFAETIGLGDIPGFLSCTDQVGIVPTIEADLAAGHGMGISGVPAVVFNGTLLGVPPDSARLFKMIDDVLVRTR